MKKSIKVAIFILVFIIYIYVSAINGIPSNLVLLEGEDINIKTIFGISLAKDDTQENSVFASSNISSDNLGISNTTLNVNLFDSITVKNINVNVIDSTTVIPVGSIAGVKLYTNGVLVVGMSEIEGIDNNKYKPYENSGIEEGDMIISVENTEILNTNDLIESVNASKGEAIDIKYMRDGQTLECSIVPTQTGESEYKLGLWVRDSAAGIGTVSFYDPNSQMFGALGHGITDIDTGDLINIANGEFVTTKVISIIKGEEGSPRKNSRNNRESRLYRHNI